MRGWIFDLYPGAPGEMVVWLKLDNGEAVRLVDRWSTSVFIGTDTKSDLAAPLQALRDEFAWTRTVLKHERITDAEHSEVVEARLKDSRKAQRVAGRIERLAPHGTFRLYNADVPPGQSYLYEHDLFPMALCEVEQDADGLSWELEDDPWSYDYAIPPTRAVRLEVEIEQGGKLPRPTDRIGSITLTSDSGEVTIDGGTEDSKLQRLTELIREADPDFIITRDGDTFLFPYLIHRAESNGLGAEFTLDREGDAMKVPAKGGTSYFSYGQVHYKPSAIKLHGRVHIDVTTSFAFHETGLEGLFELSRVCRMPLHTSSRASIGKALSSLQFYQAWKQGVLIPWKPTLAEHLKDRTELLNADRGGFIFEPKMGVREDVGEIDFSALYPNIMCSKNISAETVRCRCCPDSHNRVPELGWNVCEKRVGIVPSAIIPIIEKRLKYKELKTNARRADHARYNARQAALKWLGVTTFGYLGFNNAKFGRIDAHIAVCAWDRKAMLDAVRTAEREGYEVIHGIVDSLWVRKPGASEDDLTELGRSIASETQLSTTSEGIYKWIAFLPSKAEPGVPVLNRYFGAYRSGGMKIRGIEARRHDTPPEFKKCQMAVLDVLATADSVAEAKEAVPKCVEIFLEHAATLAKHGIPASELAFTTNLSKPPREYTTMTVQHAALKQLTDQGATLHAGEGIRYVITNYKGKDSSRSIPLDMIKDESRYDAERYIRLLSEVCSSVLSPFDESCTGRGLTLAFERRRSGGLG